MKKLTHLAVTLAVGAACALPVLAQDTGTTGETHGNTIAQGAATTVRAGATPVPGISHTISASDRGSASARTNTMGAGPQDLDRTGSDGGIDLGWFGLFGLLGLLGLRRRDHGDTGRASLHGASAR